MKLENNVAIVTGGAGSIGRATAMRLAKEGAAVVICDINAEKIDQVVEEIIAAGGKATGIRLDLQSVPEINRMAQTVIDTYGRIDILVTSAGGSARKQMALLADSEEEVIERILGVNLRGVIYCARAVVGHMIKNRRGKIINIGSIVAVNGKDKQVDYSAAKGGVIAVTKSLAIELGPHNINVNCISPGLVPRPEEMEVKNLERIRKTNVFGRIGKPEDVANLAAFLVSDEADFITGQNYIVDGGRSLGLKGD